MSNQSVIKKNKIIIDEEDTLYNDNETNLFIETKSEYKSEAKLEATKSEAKLEATLEAKSERKSRKNISITKIKMDEAEDKIVNQTCNNCEINRELLNIVRDLSDKLDNVENELKELKEMIKRKPNATTTMNEIPPINKKNVVEWLNNYVVPTISFVDFVDQLVVNMGHFEFLLDYNLSDTIQRIIQTNIVKNNDVIYPLYATVEKSGKVYVYSEDETWEVITLEYLAKFVKQIENKLSGHCIGWKNRNSGKNNFNSEYQERCQKAILKLYNISYTQDIMMDRVKRDMCVQLKAVCK